jgi:hypothetical protein
MRGMESRVAPEGVPAVGSRCESVSRSMKEPLHLQR